jgi:hypothetical protein
MLKTTLTDFEKSSMTIVDATTDVFRIYPALGTFLVVVDC